MTTLQGAKQSPIAAAKAERGGDKAAAMREYQAEKLASQGQHGAAARSAPRQGKYRFAAASSAASG